MLAGKTFFFIGAGNICESMVKGLLSTGIVRPGEIWVTNRSNTERLNFLRNYYGVVPVTDKKSAAGQADVIILAMKPQDVFTALEELKGAVNPEQLVISVLAGIPTGLIEEGLAEKVAVVRAMPNTSCAVLESATGLTPGRYTTPEQLELARSIFSMVGEVVVLEDESLLDAVTGLSGSGPAYVYYMVEAMEKAGEAAGIPREQARPLVLKTLMGAARMLMETGEKPETLRRQVTSPNGTTMAGINELEKANFQQTIRRAILKATHRSQELGQYLQKTANA
ncbi:pyrroline-5-carboxylate reductase [Desulfotomaculum nigrificans CO-1-SRB]|uniref:Pyrroline-5-carboxylate reductase n=1 Tax=Desulfotomaculum nigrificans (strain DSM 14880 / VKM B-2319 / CO-1-SRB) TaxID=868595 RepID=F6B962_DESCC|nr:pyrroline-5-carboxylate reductase [Desulfotomaculum nigrificans]AEF94834.1 pyrroline-5-carboxylate reductase [Desulfotomaculum nigrificans CO-1-SRB]